MNRCLFLTIAVVVMSFVSGNVFAERIDERQVVNDGEVREFDGVEAEGLSTEALGGVIYNAGETDILNSSFTNNEAGAGGAVYNDDGSVAISDSSFTNNEAEAGGAIYNYDGSVAISDSTFSHNLTEGSGGAIYNYGSMDISNSTFSDNKAESGGAVHNDGNNIVISNSTFTDNKAAYGGAIYNQAGGGYINFRGDNTFEGNEEDGQLNDIDNRGNITVSGNMSLDGGISGDGNITFEDRTHLTVKAGVTTIENNSFNEGATLRLDVKNGFSGDYALVTGGGALDEEFTLSDNNLYNISYTDTKGTYAISRKSDSEIAKNTGASSNEMKILSSIIDGESANDLFKKISDNISSLAQLGDTQDVKAALEAANALAPDVSPMVQQTQSEITNQIFRAVGTRLDRGRSGKSQGLSSGDVSRDVSVWMQGLANHAKLDETGKTDGFTSDTYGATFGLEKKIDKSVKAGVGYAYSTTNVDAKGRDTDIKSHTLYAYGEYKPSRLFVNGIISYDWSDYEENKNVFSNIVTGKYDVETLGMQAMVGYDLCNKCAGIVPEAGLRYLHISADKYVDSAGQNIASSYSDIITGVVGAKISKKIETAVGLRVIPEIRLAMTYDLKQANNKSKVVLPNGSLYSINGKGVNRFGIEIGGSIATDIDENLEMSVDYEGRFRKHYQDHSGVVNLKYDF